LALALALALPLAGGCTRLFDTAGLDPLASAAGFCRAESDAHYQFKVRCEGWDPTHAVQRPAYWYAKECAPKGDAVEAGRMTYDRASAEACLAAYAVGGCPGVTYAEPRNTLEACALAIAPAVPEGGECITGADCVAPGSCASPDQTCPGHCVGAGALGATCDDFAQCGRGLWCDGTRTCAPRKGSGEPCATALECMENLTCDGVSCSYVAGEGESCATLVCDPFQPLYCDGAGATCLAIPVYGQPCGNGAICAQGYYCDPSNSRCYSRPTSPQLEGGFCGFEIPCASGLWCDDTLGVPVCKARRALGTSCANANECLQPGWCDMSGSPLAWTCTAPLVAGQPCSPEAGRPCSVGAWCHITAGIEGTCESERDLGEPCGQFGESGYSYADCSAGYCALANPGDLVGVCRELGAVGAHCTSPGECLSYDCDSATSACRQPCPIVF
jgi:hypothetical protein